MKLKNSIEKLIQKENLDSMTCQEAVTEMLSDEANPLQIAAFLVLLRTKSATAEELHAITAVLRKKMIVVPTTHKVLDIVGTGGDHSNSINISTGSAILAASCGIKIAKHGNRAISSLTGTADVLEALGIAIDLSPKKVADCIAQIGIGFCFFPNFHPAAVKLRLLGKQLKISTALNFLGTLLNPANASHYLLGVYDEQLLTIIAAVLQKNKTEHSVVVHGNGLDEISCIGKTKMIEVTSTTIKPSILDPEALGLSRCTKADLQGGDAMLNAKLLLNAFSGNKSPISDTLILNAAVALYLYGLYPSIASALPHARENLYSGAAFTLLKQWRTYSHDQST